MRGQRAAHHTACTAPRMLCTMHRAPRRMPCRAPRHAHPVLHTMLHAPGITPHTGHHTTHHATHSLCCTLYSAHWASHHAKQALGTAHWAPRTGHPHHTHWALCTPHGHHTLCTMRHAVHTGHRAPHIVHQAPGTTPIPCAPTFLGPREGATAFPFERAPVCGAAPGIWPGCGWGRTGSVPCRGGTVPALSGRQPSHSRPHTRDAGQGHSPFPPIVRWRQGYGFLPVTSPGVSIGARASIPAGCRLGARTSRAGGLWGTVSCNTSKIHRAA